MSPETERLGPKLWSINKMLLNYIHADITEMAKKNYGKIIANDGIWEAGKRIGRNGNVELRSVMLLPNEKGEIRRCAFIITYRDTDLVSHFYILGRNKDKSMNTELCDDTEIFKSNPIIAESLRKSYDQAIKTLELR